MKPKTSVDLKGQHPRIPGEKHQKGAGFIIWNLQKNACFRCLDGKNMWKSQIGLLTSPLFMVVSPILWENHNVIGFNHSPYKATEKNQKDRNQNIQNTQKSWESTLEIHFYRCLFWGYHFTSFWGYPVDIFVGSAKVLICVMGTAGSSSSFAPSGSCDTKKKALCFRSCCDLIGGFKMFQDVSRCFKMFQDVSRCFKMFQDVSSRLHSFNH